MKNIDELLYEIANNKNIIIMTLQTFENKVILASL